MAELLERGVTVWEVSGSSPGRGGHKNLCRRREPSDYVRFHRAVKRVLKECRKTAVPYT